MVGENYPDTLWRGISNSDFICDGYVLVSAFQFSKAVATDGFNELSINWNDNDGSLELLLSQRKENGKLQFSAGAAKLETAKMKQYLSDFFESGTFKMERNSIPNNAYHGNLLIRNNANKQIQTMIANALALVAGTHIVPQTNA